MRLIPILVLAISVAATAALADDAPQSPKTRKYSLGIGYAGSTIKVDIPRDGNDLVILHGWGVRGCMQMKGLWGLQFRYLSGEQDFSGGGKLSLDELDVQANFKLLESDRQYFHLYATLGVTRLDFEESIPLAGIFSDRAFGASVGLGLEYGPPSYALFVDFSATFVDLRLIPGRKESWTIGNVITGLTYRF